MNSWTNYLILWVRLAFGVHMLLSGLNYYFDLIPPAQISLSPIGSFVEEMTHVGLYDMIKLVEIAVGLCLVLNIAVPVALIAEFPVTVSIFYLDVFVDQQPRQIYAGCKELFFNVFLMIAYGNYYYGMLKLRTPPWPMWTLLSSKILVDKGRVL